MQALLTVYPASAVILAGLLGLLVGSFLNVVILRLPARMEWQWRRECRALLEEHERPHGAGDNVLRLQGEGDSADQTSAEERVHAASLSPAGSVEESGAASAPDARDGITLRAGPEPVQAELEASAPALAQPRLEPFASQTTGADELEPPGIVFEASHCPTCLTPLKPWHNIPVLSWLALRGRCASCGTRISVQYPLVELLTGLAFAAVVWVFGPTWQGLAGLVFTGLLVAMAGIDARTTLLPDALTLPLLWLGLLLAPIGLFVSPEQAIWGSAIGYLSLWSVFWLFKWLTGKDGMGHGDFKLLAALGAWCGLAGLLPIVLISALVGAVVGSLWLALRGRDHATPIPFGPFLAAAGWVQLLWGEALYRWYLSWVCIGC